MRALILQMTLIFAILSSSIAMGQPDSITLRSVFIAKMLSFVEWPGGSDRPLTVRVVDGDSRESEELISAIEATGRKTLQVNGGGTGSVDILLVASKTANARKKAIAQFSGESTIAISYLDGALGDGVLVNFYEEDQHLRFEINRDGIARSKIKFSSQLLKLAKDRGGHSE